jgi:hypothetical protein
MRGRDGMTVYYRVFRGIVAAAAELLRDSTYDENE